MNLKIDHSWEWKGLCQRVEFSNLSSPFHPQCCWHFTWCIVNQRHQHRFRECVVQPMKPYWRHVHLCIPQMTVNKYLKSERLKRWEEKCRTRTSYGSTYPNRCLLLRSPTRRPSPWLFTRHLLKKRLSMEEKDWEVATRARKARCTPGPTTVRTWGHTEKTLH